MRNQVLHLRQHLHQRQLRSYSYTYSKPNADANPNALHRKMFTHAETTADSRSSPLGESEPLRIAGWREGGFVVSRS